MTTQVAGTSRSVSRSCLALIVLLCAWASLPFGWSGANPSGHWAYPWPQSITAIDNGIVVPLRAVPDPSPSIPRHASLSDYNRPRSWLLAGAAATATVGTGWISGRIASALRAILATGTGYWN